jgi:flagellar M-ring protein FliF
MPSNRRNFVDQLFEMWTRLQWSQRFTIVFFAILGMALIGSVVYFMNRVEYETLFRDLNPEDARAIRDKLKEGKQVFITEPTSKGFSIKVAASKTEIDNLLLDLSGLGLGRSGKPGWPIFDKQDFTDTELQQQVKLQRALEGELERTLSSLSAISQARVNISMCKDSLFEANREDAKASIVLILKKGSELSKSSIAGIKGIAAGTVPGLRSHNVNITDEEGNPLSQSVEQGDAARTEVENGIRGQLEKEISGKVVSLLEPLVGKGKVLAGASIVMDFNSVEQTEETTVNPNPPAIISQHKIEEHMGSQPIASGIPGTSSNVGPTGPQSLPSSPERMRQNEATNYGVNTSVRHTVQPKGTVRRLSVAVNLDHKTVYGKASDGKATSHTEALSPEEITKYRDLVLATVGFDQTRGDVVKVENIAFYKESKPEEAAPAVPWYIRWQTQTYLMPGIKYAAFIVLFIIAYLVFVRPVRKRVFQALSAASQALIEAGAPQLASDGATKALSGAAPPQQIAAPAAAAASSLPAGEIRLPEDATSLESLSDEQIERELMRDASIAGMGNRKYSAMKKKLAEKAKKDPEMVSQLIRTLIREKV